MQEGLCIYLFLIFLATLKALLSQEPPCRGYSLETTLGCRSMVGKPYLRSLELFFVARPKVECRKICYNNSLRLASPKSNRRLTHSLRCFRFLPWVRFQGLDFYLQDPNPKIDLPKTVPSHY